MLRVIRQLAVFTFALLLLTVLAQSKNGGINDQDLNLASKQEDGKPLNTSMCGIGCHTTSSSGANISITSSPGGPYIIGQTGINITVTTTDISTVGPILSIMLLNNSLLSGNIKNDGWVITEDPNKNAAPYN